VPNRPPEHNPSSGEATFKKNEADADPGHYRVETIQPSQIPQLPAKALETSKTRASIRSEARQIDALARPKPKRMIKNSPSKHITADPSQAQQRPEIVSLFQMARQYHRRDRMEQAIALYQQVLRAEPEHYDARFNLVAAYLQTAAYAKAYPIAAELFQQEPENQQVMLNLAIAHIGCGRFEKALALLDKAAEQPHAQMFEIAFHKAVVYRHLNQMESALSWYKQAEAMRPNDPGLLFNLAVAYDQNQQYEQAADYYIRFIEHDRQRDASKIQQIRQRIHTLKAYHAAQKAKE
jgi:tetratricopeptide (TPR) repeat protein